MKEKRNLNFLKFIILPVVLCGMICGSKVSVKAETLCFTCSTAAATYNKHIKVGTGGYDSGSAAEGDTFEITFTNELRFDKSNNLSISTASSYQSAKSAPLVITKSISNYQYLPADTYKVTYKSGQFVIDLSSYEELGSSLSATTSGTSARVEIPSGTTHIKLMNYSNGYVRDSGNCCSYGGSSCSATGYVRIILYDSDGNTLTTSGNLGGVFFFNITNYPNAAYYAVSIYNTSSSNTCSSCGHTGRVTSSASSNAECIKYSVVRGPAITSDLPTLKTVQAGKDMTLQVQGTNFETASWEVLASLGTDPDTNTALPYEWYPVSVLNVVSKFKGRISTETTSGYSSITLSNADTGDNGMQFRVTLKATGVDPAVSNECELSVIPGGFKGIEAIPTRTTMEIGDLLTGTNLSANQKANVYALLKYSTSKKIILDIASLGNVYMLSGTSLTEDMLNSDGSLKSEYRQLSQAVQSGSHTYMLVFDNAGNQYIGKNANGDANLAQGSVYDPLTLFVANASASSYQWQVSTDNGSTWSDCSDGSLYSGSATKELTISALTADMNGNKFRCLVNGVSATEIPLTVCDRYFTSAFSVEGIDTSAPVVEELYSEWVSGSHAGEQYLYNENNTVTNESAAALKLHVSATDNVTDADKIVYKWYKEGGIIPLSEGTAGDGANEITLNADTRSNGTYYCVISDESGNNNTEDTSDTTLKIFAFDTVNPVADFSMVTDQGADDPAGDLPAIYKELTIRAFDTEDGVRESNNFFLADDYCLLTTQNYDLTDPAVLTALYSNKGWTYKNTYVITENGTQYVYIRDAAGNISKYSLTINGIDRTAPSITDVLIEKGDATDVDVPVLDDDGNPVYEDVLDENGDPVYEDVLDENGDPVYDYDLDADGNRIQDTDKNGDPAVDENGDPIYKKHIRQQKKQQVKRQKKQQQKTSTEQKNSANITVAADDDSSLLFKIELTDSTGETRTLTREAWGIDEDGWYNNGGAFTGLTEDGVYTVYVKDSAGNVSRYSTEYIKINLINGGLGTGFFDSDEGIEANIFAYPQSATNGNVKIAITVGNPSLLSTSEPFSFDGVNFGSTAQWQVTENGVYHVWVKDTYDNIYQSNDITVNNIDKVSPTLSATTNAKNNVITITVKDEGTSGLDILKYKTPGSSEWYGLKSWGDFVSSSEAALVVDSEGTYTFVAYDKAGNSSQTYSITVSSARPNNTILDNDDSESIASAISSCITLSPTAWTNGAVTATVSLTDLTDLASLPYSWDNGQTWTGKQTYSYSENGDTYKLLVKDCYGHTYTSNPIVVGNIDKTAPSVTLTASGTNDLIISATDLLSGISKIQWMGGTLSTFTPLAAPSDNPSTYAVTASFPCNGVFTIEVYDAAGNKITRTYTELSYVNPADSSTSSSTSSGTSSGSGSTTTTTNNYYYGSGSSGSGTSSGSGSTTTSLTTTSTNPLVTSSGTKTTTATPSTTSTGTTTSTTKAATTTTTPSATAKKITTSVQPASSMSSGTTEDDVELLDDENLAKYRNSRISGAVTATGDNATKSGFNIVMAIVGSLMALSAIAAGIYLYVSKKPRLAGIEGGEDDAFAEDIALEQQPK